jgi:hypothetical protein
VETVSSGTVGVFSVYIIGFCIDLPWYTKVYVIGRK